MKTIINMKKFIVAFSALAATISITPAEAYDRRVRIYNDTSYTMTRFHASNVGTNVWEEDILGRSVLRPGQSVMVNINDGSGYCRFDLRATFSDGDQVIARRFNVCEETHWRVYD